ncbi:MAG: hypothetical protein IJT59_03575 [Desulfovibrionaceae bacterium]|nr:hypothetical protein [Desulfovibrionaceae bacterium]
MFTEEASKKQDETFQALKDEFARLDQLEKDMRKSLNLPPEGDVDLDMNDLPAEVKSLGEEAKAKAKREGAARAAQFSAESNQPTSTGGVPGGRRKGVLRI